LPDDGFHVAVQLRELRDQSPSQAVFQLSPPARDGMALGAIGREEQTDHMVRESKRFRLMTTSMIHQHDMERLLIGVCELRQKDLNVCRVQLGSLQKKAFPGCWLDGSLHLEVLELIWH
jgi:hypothetical protein